MIKDPITDNITINVKLKSGEEFLNKNVTSAPMGEEERNISFWIDDKKIRTYSLRDVEYFEFVEN